MFIIDLLKYHTTHIEQLADIWYENLGKKWLPELSKEYIRQLIGDWIYDDKLPLAYIVFKDKEPIAMASLQQNCGIRFDLTPWLGSLIVKPEYQNQGIGKMLIDITKNKAKELNYNKIYLFTFDPELYNYYFRLGWHTIGTDHFNNKKIDIMEIKL